MPVDLFQTEEPEAEAAERPLAYRLRPRTFDEIVGQRHLVAPQSGVRRAVEAGRCPSLILFGPPGCGKTALARVIAATTGARFRRLNAVADGLAQLKPILTEARRLRAAGQPPTLLFVDEIHRFNKTQQDALLPETERGDVVLMGASTENPFHALVPPLRSRCQVYRLEPLTEAELEVLLDRALTDPRGLGGRGVELEPAARATLLALANGDARRLLNALEMCCAASAAADGKVRVTEETVRSCLQYGGRRHDRDGDDHYDTISAFIKSVRGSDPDAAVYWLAKMVEGGEDPRFIARRLVILAAEDVGLADPLALVVADACFSAVERVGMPEARLILSEATLYLALAPKSNSATTAIGAACREVRERPTLEVPLHLRDTHYRGAEKLGHGEGYRYPHRYPGHYVAQAYLPEPRTFYTPGDQGREPALAERLAALRRAAGEPSETDPAGREAGVSHTPTR
ncbi:MAG: replication-associated recombination protein A [Nitrospirae bacterium]|nr:MAG: replication-associated recombination protein A [Nitrospirota bacterium]